MHPEEKPTAQTQSGVAEQRSQKRVALLRINVQKYHIEINLFLTVLGIIVAIILGTIPFWLNRIFPPPVTTATPVIASIQQICTNSDNSISVTCWSDWPRAFLDSANGTHGLLLTSPDNKDHFHILPTIDTVASNDYPTYFRSYLEGYSATSVSAPPATATSAVAITGRAWTKTTVDCVFNGVEYHAALYGIGQTTGTLFVVMLAPTTIFDQVDQQRFQVMLQSLKFPA